LVHELAQVGGQLAQGRVVHVHVTGSVGHLHVTAQMGLERQVIDCVLVAENGVARSKCRWR
jgi:hypothetical protein